MLHTENFILRFHHYYVPTEHLNKNGEFEKKPVATMAIIRDRNENLISEGTAKCSKHDLFEKEIGRRISLLRAVDSPNLGKEDRREILSTYFNRKRK
jgi:hypothetical protein